MNVTSFSVFYYGFIINTENIYLMLDEGSGELLAEVNVGNYSLTEFLDAVKVALDTAGTQTYTVAADRNSRLVTISAASNFDLLIASGSSVGSDCFGLLGFTGADRTGSNAYTGNVAAGFEYMPQFWLQDFIHEDAWQSSVDATVKQTATGRVEVVRFGVEKFYQMRIKYATNRPMDGKVIRNNQTGVDDLVSFLQFCVKKAPIEFMLDATSRSNFVTIILESTDESRDGVGYRLKELYDQNLPGFYDSGLLKFRVLE